MQIEGMFGIDSAVKSKTTIPLKIVDLESLHWNVGLIVGASGAGKTTVANHLFKTQMQAQENMIWSAGRSLVDDFPKDMTIKDITELLTSVGFSSPPAWLRPFSALSNGEQFRVSMARLLAENPELTVVDEFTSVVDRTVAKVGSHAIAKTTRRRDQKFVAVTCHYDVEDWLQPDWIYEPATGDFRWRSVQPRPSVELKIERTGLESWKIFRRHHYLSETLPLNGKMFLATIDGQPAAFCCVVPFPHPKTKNLWRIARSVVIPDFQGIGVGRAFTDLIAASFLSAGKVVISTTGHPQMIRARMASPSWKMTAAPRRTAKPGKSSTMKSNATASNRLVASFKFTGKADPTLLPLILQK